MKYRALIVALIALCWSVLITACSSETMSGTTSLSYSDVKGTGLANNCPTLAETSRGSIPLQTGGDYRLTNICLQPTNYFVKEESTNKRGKAHFVPGKVLTRLTSSIEQVSGSLKVNSDGSLTFTEDDGIDFQAITVLLPGGEEVPFLFTIKQLVAQSQPGVGGLNASVDFKGPFNVPSYRSGTFLDPKGRGLATGYDNAVALPAQADGSKLVRTNVKLADTKLKAGKISLQITKVNADTGEIAGIFESVQPSDTDLGAKEAVDVKIQGQFYGRLEEVQS
jgi:photosystem II oxygen-evolving enhancer protein 1